MPNNNDVIEGTAIVVNRPLPVEDDDFFDIETSEGSYIPPDNPILYLKADSRATVYILTPPNNVEDPSLSWRSYRRYFLRGASGDNPQDQRKTVQIPVAKNKKNDLVKQYYDSSVTRRPGTVLRVPVLYYHQIDEDTKDFQIEARVFELSSKAMQNAFRSALVTLEGFYGLTKPVKMKVRKGKQPTMVKMTATHFDPEEELHGLNVFIPDLIPTMTGVPTTRSEVKELIALNKGVTVEELDAPRGARKHDTRW